ncbi:C-C chemokine receptor type 5-like [Hydractinia symbiolongicarpus]|uniref:C-C chemokine receptor type 5-like n=1 Tax=Hydractinia symbiolongicarpus TaxID=13093 RepID=UPI00254E36D7|nr:C-C chemokine receptor type 5-like [Hydractinia symbiolongicarpus]
MNITTFRNHSWHGDLFKDTPSRIAIMVMHSVLTIMGIAFNIFICVSHYLMKTPLKKFNICFVNLCVTNIVMLTGLLPMLAIDMHKNPELSATFLTDIFCGFSQGQCFSFVGIFSGIHTLSVMSISRYLAVKKPFRLGLTKKKMLKLLCFDWIVCVILHFPNAILWRHHDGFCYRYWKWGTTFKVVYVFTLYVVGLVVPIITMLVAFVLTVWEFFHGEITSIQTAKLRYRKRIVVLTGTLIILWIVSHIPYAVYWLLSVVGHFPFTYHGEIKRQRWKWFAYFPAIVNAILEPILFGAFSSEFKKSIRVSFTLRNSQMRT